MPHNITTTRNLGVADWYIRDFRSFFSNLQISEYELRLRFTSLSAQEILHNLPPLSLSYARILVLEKNRLAFCYNGQVH